MVVDDWGYAPKYITELRQAGAISWTSDTHFLLNHSGEKAVEMGKRKAAKKKAPKKSQRKALSSYMKKNYGV